MKRIFIVLSLFAVLSSLVFAQSNFTVEDFGLQQQPEQLQQQQPEQQTVQWLSTVEESCKPCMEGEQSSFKVSLTNAGDNEFAVRFIALVDSSGVVFASGNVDTILSRNSTKNFTIDSIVPPPTRGKTLFYTMCLGISSGSEIVQSCEQSARRMIVQNNVETNLSIIYILLAVILLVMTAFFLLFLRKLDKKK